MQEEACVNTSGRWRRTYGDDESGVEPTGDLDLPWRSVEILQRDEAEAASEDEKLH